MIAINAGAAAIDLHGDVGDLAAAAAVHDDVVATVSALWDQPYFAARIRLAGLLLGQLATEAIRASGRERDVLGAQADELAAAVRLVGETGRAGGRRFGPKGQVWLARVEAEHARVRWLTGVDGPYLE